MDKEILKKTKKKKKTTQTATSEELRVKIGYCACPLHTPTKEVKKHLSHPSSPRTGPAPTVSPYKEPPWGDNQGTHYLFSVSLAAVGAPVKPCLKFLSHL